MIDLFTPYERRVVQIVGNRDTLRTRQVRAVVVDIDYVFFGEPRRQSVLVRPDQQGDDPRVEITLPLGQQQYAWTVTWQFEGGRRATTKGVDSSGIVFIDEFPN